MLDGQCTTALEWRMNSAIRYTILSEIMCAYEEKQMVNEYMVDGT